jgi:hypothetical protein
VLESRGNFQGNKSWLLIRLVNIHAGSIAKRVATLDAKAGFNAVKNEPVEKTFAG